MESTSLQLIDASELVVAARLETATDNLLEYEITDVGSHPLARAKYQPGDQLTFRDVVFSEDALSFRVNNETLSALPEQRPVTRIGSFKVPDLEHDSFLGLAPPLRLGTLGPTIQRGWLSDDGTWAPEHLVDGRLGTGVALPSRARGDFVELSIPERRSTEELDSLAEPYLSDPETVAALLASQFEVPLGLDPWWNSESELLIDLTTPRVVADPLSLEGVMVSVASEDSLPIYGRPKALQLWFSATRFEGLGLWNGNYDRLVTLDLADRPGNQIFAFSEPIDALSVVIRVEQSYPGVHDASILTEIDFLTLQE